MKLSQILYFSYFLSIDWCSKSNKKMHFRVLLKFFQSLELLFQTFRAISSVKRIFNSNLNSSQYGQMLFKYFFLFLDLAIKIVDLMKIIYYSVTIKPRTSESKNYMVDFWNILNFGCRLSESNFSFSQKSAYWFSNYFFQPLRVTNWV